MKVLKMSGRLFLSFLMLSLNATDCVLTFYVVNELGFKEMNPFFGTVLNSSNQTPAIIAKIIMFPIIWIVLSTIPFILLPYGVKRGWFKPPKASTITILRSYDFVIFLLNVIFGLAVTFNLFGAIGRLY